MLWITKNRYKRMNSIIPIVFFAIWLIYVCMHWCDYSYQYPTILDIWGFCTRTVGLPCLLLIVLILAGVFHKNNKQAAANVLYILYIPLLLIAILLGFVEHLYAPTLCSYTAKVEDFGAFDKIVEERIELNPVPEFPNQIPDEDVDVQYCYFYKNASNEAIYIVASLSFENRSTFENIVHQIELEQDISLQNKSAYILQKEYFYNLILLDYQTNQISYVVSNLEELLPDKVSNVVKPPHDFI